MTGVTAMVYFGVVMLVALVVAGIGVLRAKSEEELAERRVARLTEGIAASAARAQRGPAVKLHERPQVRRLLSPLGIDTRRLDEYPLPFWAVLAMVLVAAKAATSAITLLFGLSGALDVLLTPVLFVLISRKVFATFHARRSTALFNQLPDALSTIVRCVRVGIPVQEAFRIIATDMQPPISVEFGRLADRIALGVAVEQALPDLAERSGLPEFHFFASALALQARTGGGLAQTLETLAEVIRKRVTAKARGYALASEARTSALILGALPIISGIGLFLLKPHYMMLLFTTPLGRKLFGAAVLLLCTGATVMRGIIRKSLS